MKKLISKKMRKKNSRIIVIRRNYKDTMITTIMNNYEDSIDADNDEILLKYDNDKETPDWNA